MNTVKTIFEFTCDNAQLALDEISLQIHNLGLEHDDLRITDTSDPASEEDDWFDDTVFTISTNVSSETLSCNEIKTLIENGSFENYVFI